MTTKSKLCGLEYWAIDGLCCEKEEGHPGKHLAENDEVRAIW